MSYYCKNCDKHWSYPVKNCIFCKGDIREANGAKYRVIGFTQVNIPSSGNEKVPYYDYLMHDGNGNKIIKKSFSKYDIGDVVDTGDNGKRDRVIGIVGTGQLGSGIAELALRYNYPTVQKTRSKETSDKILSKIGGKLSKDNTREQVVKYLENLTITTDYPDLGRCDIIIEAVAEDMELKKGVFKELSRTCNDRTILATNTSSLSIDEIADATDRPDKVIGMHFFNPVTKMDLIEVVIGKKTSEDTVRQVMDICGEINKKPISVSNSPGFIVNRLLLPQINDAVRLMEDGVATKEGIDAAMKMGLNHPMGPFQLADLIGNDTCVLILNTLYDSLKEERYKPAITLRQMVNSGKLGRKSGEGFYKYE